MQINVWYSCDGKYHRFASLYDECNYCYPVDTYTFAEAKEQYITDHAFEGFDYNFIGTPEC